MLINYLARLLIVSTWSGFKRIIVFAVAIIVFMFVGIPLIIMEFLVTIFILFLAMFDKTSEWEFIM
jgi:hypothetical protein